MSKTLVCFSACYSLLGREYNLVTDNCASFILSMANELGIIVTNEMKAFVIENLAHSDIPDMPTTWH